MKSDLSGFLQIKTFFVGRGLAWRISSTDAVFLLTTYYLLPTNDLLTTY